MPMNAGDIIAVQFCQELFSQQVCMVWTVRIDANPDAVDITDWLTVLIERADTAINAAQSHEINNVALIGDNLTDGVSFGEAAWTGGGNDSSAGSAPSFVAASIRLNRGNKITRNGGKRLAGLPLNVIQDNAIIDANYMQRLNDLGAFFSDPVTDALDNVDYTPVIVGRLPNGGYDLARVQPIVSATAKSVLTSQVSRRAGKGD